MSSASYEEWDPILQKDLTETPSQSCSYRIKRDLVTLCNDPPYGLFVVPDDNDITIVHALITGAFDTPYEGGCFYFILRCPPDYPLRPPRVKLMTTGGGEVRFNPNLYKNGKVCLSILGTWSGPCWSPAQSICSVLISIQSVLNEKPYHNEPGFEVEKLPGDVERYNEIIQHETIRVAVCGMIENDSGLNIPPMLKNIMEKTFLQYYDYYESVAMKKMAMTGLPMQDPFSEKRGRFQYKSILARLQAIRTKLLANPQSGTELTDTSTRASSPGSETDLDDDSSNSCQNNTEAPCELAAGDSSNTRPDSGKVPCESSNDSHNVCPNADKNPSKQSSSNLSKDESANQSVAIGKIEDDQTHTSEGSGDHEDK